MEGGFRGVIFNKLFGVKPVVYKEGTHFLIPFLEFPVIFDVRSRPRSIGSPTGSKGNDKRKTLQVECHFEFFFIY